MRVLLAAAAAGDRALEQGVRRHRGRGSLPAAASPAAVEPGGGTLDGLGTQARQASRVQSTAARRSRHQLRRGRRPAAVKVPAGVRYVISLDADTRLPRGAALRSSARWPIRSTGRSRCRDSGAFVAGYGILQPRVTPSLPVGPGCLDSFRGVFSGPSGIDPYAFAVSDVYQDMFGEGSYTGKGIYDRRRFRNDARQSRRRQSSAQS